MSIISQKKIRSNHHKIATILAFGLIPLSGIATDIYLPSMPAMKSALSINSLEVQLTLSVFLISYGISQLFIGSFIDSFGRYNIGLAALILFTVSSFIIANTENIYIIYTMRILHGITVAGIVVAKRAYFVDIFTGDRLKSYLSIFTIIWSTGPIMAPFLGGYLQSFFGWKSNFYFLAAFGIIFLILELIFSGETLKNPAEFKLKKIVGIYYEMIGTTNFMLGIFMLGLAYSMVMIYNMSGPFIIEHTFSMTSIIAGYCSVILGFSWMIGGFIAKGTIKIPFNKKMILNIMFQIIFATCMILSTDIMVNIYTLILFAFLIHICAGYTYNNYFAYSLSRFPKNAGIAGGLTGGAVYIIVSLLSYVVMNIFPAKDEQNLSYGYLILSLISGILMFILYRFVNKPKVPLNRKGI